MPRKIKVPKIVFHFKDTPEGRAGLQRAYNRIFDLTWEDIQKERQSGKEKEALED